MSGRRRPRFGRMRTARPMLVMAVFATLLGALVAAPDGRVAESAGGDFTLQRVAGANRVATSIAASRTAFPSGAADVVIARADEFPDALAGNALAGQLGAPILLSARTDVPDEVVNEVARLGASRDTSWAGHRRWARKWSQNSKPPGWW